MKLYHKNTSAHQQEQLNIFLPIESIRRLLKENLLSLCTEVGLLTLNKLFENEVEGKVGKKYARNQNRTANRHGYEDTSVVLGGQKVSIKKPRMRSIDNKIEIPLDSLSIINKDPLSESVLVKLLSGISCRKYDEVSEIKNVERRSTSKSSIHRTFQKSIKQHLEGFLTRKYDCEKIAAIMIDGIHFANKTFIAAMGINANGEKIILGIIEGVTENSGTCKMLLDDLVSRGLSPNIHRLFTIDGSKALSKAIVDVFGDKATIQRCQIHKTRNVLEHLPKSMEQIARRRIKKAYLEQNYTDAKQQLSKFIQELEEDYPSAAKSLREGLEETLSVHKLNIPGLLRLTLSNTNALESMNSVVRTVTARVKNPRGNKAADWIAAGMKAAENSCRRVRGYKSLSLLYSILNQEKDQVEQVRDIA